MHGTEHAQALIFFGALQYEAAEDLVSVTLASLEAKISPAPKCDGRRNVLFAPPSPWLLLFLGYFAHAQLPPTVLQRWLAAYNLALVFVNTT